MLAELAINQSGDEPERPLSWQRSPVARVLFRDANGANSRHVTEFYELLRKARTAGATLRAQPGAEAMRRYAEEHRDELHFLATRPRGRAARPERAY